MTAQYYLCFLSIFDVSRPDGFEGYLIAIQETKFKMSKPRQGFLCGCPGIGRERIALSFILLDVYGI
jgi:hypothetical protein